MQEVTRGRNEIHRLLTLISNPQKIITIEGQNYTCSNAKELSGGSTLGLLPWLDHILPQKHHRHACCRQQDAHGRCIDAQQGTTYRAIA